MNKINIVIPMAGKSKRFLDNGYKIPKFMIPIKDELMISHVIKNLNIEGNYIYIVQEKDIDKYNLNKELKKITPNCNIIGVNKLTKGAAETVLLAENFINNKNPLIIVNCDQLFKWQSKHFINFIKQKIDGAIVVFQSFGKQWSYVNINSNGLINLVAEKKEISNYATAGLYFWKNGSDYIKYAKQMIKKNIKTNNEFYVCPVYNEAIIDNKQIKPFFIDKFYSLGTPNDLSNSIKEYFDD